MGGFKEEKEGDGGGEREKEKRKIVVTTQFIDGSDGGCACDHPDSNRRGGGKCSDIKMAGSLPRHLSAAIPLHSSIFITR